MNKKAFCLWSGGKDSHLALMKALAQGYDVALLVTFFSELTRYSLSHRVPARLLRDQASLLGIYLQEVYVGRDEYEQRLRNILQSLAPQGIDHAIFGDIHLEEHKSWNEHVCAECNITPVFPLWGQAVEAVFDEQRSLRSLIVSVESKKIDKQWLGKYVDERFRETLAASGIDICGEKGEYHTVVVQSPLMKGRIQIGKWKEHTDEAYVGLDIQEWSVVQESINVNG